MAVPLAHRVRRADGVHARPRGGGGRATAGRPAPHRAARSLAWQNLSYALQWWVFSLFGLFFWYRLVRDDARGELRRPDHADPAGAGPDGIGDDERDEQALTPDAGGRP